MKQISKKEIKELSLKKLESEEMMEQFITWAKSFVNMQHEEDRPWLEANIVPTSEQPGEMYGKTVKFLVLHGSPHRGYIIIDYGAQAVTAICTSDEREKKWSVQRAFSHSTWF